MGSGGDFGTAWGKNEWLKKAAQQLEIVQREASDSVSNLGSVEKRYGAAQPK
jgi:hypothetical protein